MCAPVLAFRSRLLLLFFFHGWAQAARELTRTFAHYESSEFRSFTMCVSAFPRVRVRVAPQGGMGPSLRAPSACRTVICELMSSERVLWLFVPHLSWRWQVSLHGHANVHAHVPSSSIVSLRKILCRTSCQDHVPDTERPKLVNEVPKDQVAVARKCAHGKKLKCGVFCHESRSPVYMTVGTWCLPMSMVTCSRKCIDSIRPSVLVKLSCRLCRLVFSCSVHCLRSSVRGHD